MALSPGTWLNHYEVLGHLGTGGMGEVYRARDNKLQREVALKVLPKAFAQDPERVARFRREAQVLAQLNHTNIAAICSVEQTMTSGCSRSKESGRRDLSSKVASLRADLRSHPTDVGWPMSPMSRAGLKSMCNRSLVRAGNGKSPRPAARKWCGRAMDVSCSFAMATA